MAKQKTQVTNKEAHPLPVALADAKALQQVIADGGGGFEEATRDSYAIPFLLVLQDLSPQTKSKMAGYVKGAEPGMIYHTVSQELMQSCRVIPCHFTPVYIEWVPRNKGGGFVASHSITSAILSKATRDKSKYVLPNGNEVLETAQHYVLLQRPDGSTDTCLIPMKSTQLKISRRWMTAMRGATVAFDGKLYKAPMWAYSYKLTTEEEANDQGSWYSWVFGDRMPVYNDASLYAQAKAFHDSVSAGAVKVNYDDLARVDGGSSEGGDFSNDLDA